MKKWINFYFNPRGRTPIDEFFFEFVLPIGLLFFGLKWLFVRIVGPDADAPLLMQASSLMAVAILLWPMICVTTKRLHDSGLSGWWQFLFAIPIWIAPPFSFLWVRIFWTFEGGFFVALGWFAIGIAAIVSGIAVIGLRSGTVGTNRYGEDPRQEVTSKRGASA